VRNNCLLLHATGILQLFINQQQLTDTAEKEKKSSIKHNEKVFQDGS
jgi:hypothetical protein